MRTIRARRERDSNAAAASPGGWLAAFGNLAVGEATTSVLRFVGFLWVARQLGPAPFGAISAGLAVGTYLATLAHSGLEILGSRRMAAEPARLPNHLGEIVAVRLGLAGAVYALTAVVAEALDLDGQTRTIVLVYALLVFTQAADVRWAFIGIQRTRPVAIASVASSATYLAGVLALVHSPDDVLRVPLLHLGGEVLLAAVLIAVSRRRFGSWRSPRIRASARATLRASLPISLTQCARTGIISVDVVLVRLMRPADEAGYYSAASRFALAGIVFLGIYYTTFLPSLVRARGEGSDAFRGLVRLAARRAAWVAVPFGLLFTVAVPAPTHLLLSPSYQPAAGLLQVLVWGLVLLAFGGIYANVLIAVHREGRLAAVTVGALVVNLVANLTLLPTVGTVGASISTILAEAVFLVGCYLSARPFLDGRPAGMAVSGESRR